MTNIDCKTFDATGEIDAWRPRQVTKERLRDAVCDKRGEFGTRVTSDKR